MNWILPLKVLTLLCYIALLTGFLIACGDNALKHVIALRLASPL